MENQFLPRTPTPSLMFIATIELTLFANVETMTAMITLLNNLKTDTDAKLPTLKETNALTKFLKEKEFWPNTNGDGKLRQRKTRLLIKTSTLEPLDARRVRLPIAVLSE